MGRPALKDDPRYRDHASRGAHQAELDGVIAAWTRERTVDDLLAVLEAHAVPCGRIFRAPDMLADPQFQAREAIVETDHPVFGRVKMQNVFPKFSDTPGSVRWPGPGLGEHTIAVLTERLGLASEEITALRAEGVI